MHDDDANSLSPELFIFFQISTTKRTIFHQDHMHSILVASSVMIWNKWKPKNAKVVACMFSGGRRGNFFFYWKKCVKFSNLLFSGKLTQLTMPRGQIVHFLIPFSSRKPYWICMRTDMRTQRNTPIRPWRLPKDFIHLIIATSFPSSNMSSLP